MATMPENVSQLSKLIPKPEKDLGCQMLIQMPDVSKYGFLRKMSDSRSGRLFDSVLNRRWSSKFVILRSGCVYIYSSEMASNYDRANTLFGFQDVFQSASDVYKAGQWSFQVVDALQDQEKDRSMYFSASSESDMKEWIEAFQKEICVGNLAVFPSSSQERLKPRASLDLPAEKRTVMPRISDEIREKMRKSIALEKNVSICDEDQGLYVDADEYVDVVDIDETKREAETTPRKTLLAPSQSVPMPANKGEIAATRVNLKPLPKPRVAEQPKPPPVNPTKQDPPTTPVPVAVKPMKRDPLPAPAPGKATKLDPPSAPTPASTKPRSQDPPLAFPKPVLPKPTNPVKPLLSSQPSLLPKPSKNDLKGRMVPQPPGLNVSPQTNHEKFTGVYEEGSVYVYNKGEEYEHWGPEEESLNDPLIKASYWTQDVDEALQIMVSINEEGVFLIRDASDGLDYKTLMVCASETEKTVRKYKIIKESTRDYSLHLGESGFKSLQELVQYYQKNSLPNRTLKLTKPYSEVWKPK